MPRILVFGNCQAEIIADILKKIPAIQEGYEVDYHFVRIRERDWEGRAVEAAQADLVFAQAISDWDCYPLRDLIRSTTPIFQFPFVYLAALWPFDTHQNPADKKAVAERGMHGAWNFDYQDSLLGRLRDDVPDPEERYNRYAALSTPGVPNLARYCQVEAQRIRNLDARLSSHVGEFILDNFRERRLFHTITHPTMEVIRCIAEGLLSKVDIKTKWTQPEEQDRLSVYQTPVHPRVISELGLQWADSTTLYNFREHPPMTFETYIRKYIEVYG